MTTADAYHPALSAEPTSGPQSRSQGPRVYAVMVVNNAAGWLADVLEAFSSQRYADLELVVVDNGSTDDSRSIIARRVAPERFVRFRRNVGFGRAVHGALKRADLDPGDFVLLLHDDLVLAPDAIARMVEALRHDPNLSIVGPKLREWSADAVLQEVGGTIDRFGRPESPVEPGELDQGQHDRQREVLYVSTAGMLLRADTLRTIGGFDTRYPAFRDDLDLCWRAWLFGHRVEVVPSAVGYHVGAATRRMRRLGLGRVPRELAERHTLATILTNYELRRLLWILPSMAVLAVAKVLAFLATRRVGDAIAVVRAYAWNVLQLPRTLQRRRRIQRMRTVTDGELAWLFAPGLPRFRLYGEAIADWVAGGTTRAFLPDTEEHLLRPPPPEGNALVRALRSHPAVWTAGLLVLVFLVGLFPLLGGGQLVGGEVLPWPRSALDFLRSYVSSWSGGPVGSPAARSPAQVLLGIASLAGLGSAWLAQRLVVLGLFPLAWISALRAGRLVTSRPGARAFGATLYVLSPAVLGALAQGLIGPMVAAALLPALVLLAVRVVAPAELWSGTGVDRNPTSEATAASAWRAAALLTLGLTAGLAVGLYEWPVLLSLYAATLAAAIVRREGIGRVVFVGLGTLALLAPWLIGLAREGWPIAGVAAPDPLPLWRALAVVPEVLPGLDGAGGVVAGLAALAVIAPALILGMPARQALVLGLVGVYLTSALAAWAVGRVGIDGFWTPTLLLPAALAIAGLGVVAGRGIPRALREPDPRLRQVAVVGSVALVGVGLVIGMVRLGAGPYEGLARVDGLLPPFVTADEDRVGPYRVLLLGADPDGTITFEAVDATGITMERFGSVPSEEMVGALQSAVEAAVGGGDPLAANTLGTLGVRYVVVQPEAAQTLAAPLARQPALSPVPFDQGLAYQLTTWLPRATVLPSSIGEQLLVAGSSAEVGGAEELGLQRFRRDLYQGAVPFEEGGLVVLSEEASSRWEATADGIPLERRVPGSGPGADLPLNAFVVPGGAENVQVGASSLAHLLTLVAQVIILLAVVSLALRPPGEGPRRFGPPRVGRRAFTTEQAALPGRSLPPFDPDATDVGLRLPVRQPTPQR